MATVDKQRAIIKRMIQQYAQVKPVGGDIQMQAVLDEAGDHYILMNVGWSENKRVYFPAIHIDLIEGKVWLQCDNTSAVIADELVEAGIPKEQIVLGFRAPDLRPYTGFGEG